MCVAEKEINNKNALYVFKLLKTVYCFRSYSVDLLKKPAFVILWKQLETLLRYELQNYFEFNLKRTLI